MPPANHRNASKIPEPGTRSSARGSRFAPHLALVFVQILFGTWPIFGKIALRSLPTTGLVTFRVLGGAIALAFMQQFRKKQKGKFTRSDLGWLALCSLLGVVPTNYSLLKACR